MARIRGTGRADTLIGTRNDDQIVALAGNDRIIGSRGNDRIDGGAGTDTIDYRSLNTDITLTPGGGVNKGNFGTDLLIGIERIIGNANRVNTIDASIAGAGAGMSVDLSTNTMTVDIPGIGTQQFTVENFVNAIGSNNSDTIVGGATASNLSGGGGNDTVSGGSGDDIINGTSEATRGVGEIDTLTGGTGLNTFVLGGAAGFHYVGSGNNDYAQINNFNLFEDAIDIGSAITYDLGLGNNGELNLFADTNGIRDLVAKIQLAPETQFAVAAAPQAASFGAGGDAIGLAKLAANSPLLPNLKVVSSAGTAIAPISASAV